MLHDYDLLIRQFRSGDDRQPIIDHLDVALPDMWQHDYVATAPSSNLLVITFGDESRVESFCRYMFDHTSGRSDSADITSGDSAERTEDRVVAVWGTSRHEPARTRDASRMKGFLGGAWSRAYGGSDRGHFFAHTMGGGLDINLFPQESKVNRGGLWRKMETYCALNPGTFCFIHPIYGDRTWRPRQLEYGIFKLQAGEPVVFWGHMFEN